MKKFYLIGALAIVFMMASNGFAKTDRFKGYNFRAHVVKANHQVYKEFRERGKTLLKVRPQEEYSIVVYNPLPVRVAVAVTIDGLNSVDGKRTSPRHAQKWMIDPHSSITVSGWQTSKQTLRKFVFTEDTAAYAKWREKKEGKPYAQNIGVIGIAWFWNKQELHRELHPPKPFLGANQAGADFSVAESESKRRSSKASQAGTGMGTEQQHHVHEVEFHANAGMFSVKDVMQLFYEFAKEPKEPQPFIDEERDTIRFTPEMP